MQKDICMSGNNFHTGTRGRSVDARLGKAISGLVAGETETVGWL